MARVGGENRIQMSFRSHLGRDMDLRSRSNQAILAMVAVVALIALIRWIDGRSLTVFLAPATVFAVWALGREIDADHNWTALLAALGAAVWALRGIDWMAVVAFAGLVGMGRLISNTTGRPPLPVDRMVVAIAGIVIGITAVGWVAGFGLAVALYIDDRMGEFPNSGQVMAAAVTAIGTTAVAAISGAFSAGLPVVTPYLAVVTAAIALLLALREPAEPTSFVDFDVGTQMDKRRLHASRVTVGLTLLGMTVLAGPDALDLVPAIFMLALAVVSNEAELARRSRR